MKLYLDIELECHGKFTPARAGSMYRNNGDPGDPPESADVMDFTFTYDGKPIELSDVDYDRLLDQYMEECEANEYDLDDECI